MVYSWVEHGTNASMSFPSPTLPWLGTRRTVMSGLAALAALPLHSNSPGGLRDPFATQADRWHRIKSLGSIAAPPRSICAPVASVVRDLVGTTYYTDSKGSVVDPAREAEWRRQREPILSFTQAVEQQTATWLATLGTALQPADCAGRWLDTWARANALNGTFNSQGRAALRWCTAGLANAYLNIRSAIHRDRRTRIERWFGSLGRRCRIQVPLPNNNHRFWAAAAAAAAAVAANDEEGLAWAIEVGRDGLNEVSDEGVLPLEIARGRRALSYHTFAMSALLMLAEYAYVNGIDLYKENDQALSRVVDFIIRNMDDRAEVTRLAGVQQEWKAPSDGTLAWAEIWYARFKEPRLVAPLIRLRPLEMDYLGGNITLMFGRKLIKS